MAQNGLLTQLQSTRPRGALRCGLSPSTTARWFQSTRPRGARHQSPNHPYKGLEFQSTRPRGARRSRSLRRSGVSRFNPRAHVGRDARIRAGRSRSSSFNPRAHVGRDGAAAVDAAAGLLVSIHAPTWGATCGGGEPPPPEQPVSIHAPTWGATMTVCACSTISMFQSTRPRGARHETVAGQRGKIEFQSTRPRGARQRPLILTFKTNSFNPRAHVGRDKTLKW